MLSSKDLFLTGLALMKRNDHRLAAELAASAVLDFPDDGNLWELLGVARHHLRNHRSAIEALETASLLKPLDVGARFCLAGAYADCAKPQLAVFLYRMIADDAATPEWLLPKVASRLGRLDAPADALVACFALLRRDPDRHEAHFGTAFYLRRTGAPNDRVIDAVVRAHELAPHVAMYRIVLAGLWEEAGRRDDAYELLRDVEPGSVGCVCSLRRMMRVFDGAGDRARFAACERRLSQLCPPEADEATGDDR